jgi:hypothetical protein
MWVAKKGFENTNLKYKLGIVEVSVNVNEITESHIDVAKKFGVDLTYYLEEIKVEAVNVEEEVIEVKPKKTRTRKK